jgi:HAD superfamily hydrolase (TIGR01490 family)
MPRLAALFDMDRTLVKKDTAGLYTRYRRDRGEVSLMDVLRVSFWMAQYTFGVIDAPRVARQALAYFRGMEEKALIESCEGWFHDYVLPHVQAAGRAAVERHRERGDLIAIVTGASKYAASPLAAELRIDEVVCTELEVDAEGRFTGAPLEPLCYGAGKLERAKRLAERHGFELAEATFYSDSITDLPLLEAVRNPRAVNPDARLRRVARQRGWPVEQW